MYRQKYYIPLKVTEDRFMSYFVTVPVPVSLWKNYLFCGNPKAAQNMAVVCSLLATCRNHDVNPRDYLNDIISQMPYHTKASYEELLQLLPHKWKLTHPESVMTKTT